MGKVPDMIPVFAGRPGNGDCPGLVIKEPLIKTKSKRTFLQGLKPSLILLLLRHD